MTQLKNQQMWVVIPAYNEARYLKKVLTQVLRYSRNVIVVDDGSQDQTTAIAQQFPVYVLTHRLNLGKGAALSTACQFAFEKLKARAVIMMDGDAQHDPKELKLFQAALKKGSQVVFGIRQEPRHMPWLRLKVNRLGSFLTYLLFQTYILDIPSGYKAFTKNAYKYLAWKASDYAVEIEIAARTARARLPFTYVTIKTIYHDTTKGMTALDILSIVRHMIKLKATL